jgi:segregation and condensation protein B
LAFLLERERIELKKLSRAATEALAIIAYHQPVTRAEIEEIRGVALSKGTIDVLLDAGWIRPRGRRETPGRPMTYGTTEEFLIHFSIEKLADLPGIEELKAAGLLDAQPKPETPLLPGMGDEGADQTGEGDMPSDADRDIEQELAERVAADVADDGQDDLKESGAVDEPGETGEPGELDERVAEDHS